MNSQDDAIPVRTHDRYSRAPRRKLTNLREECEDIFASGVGGNTSNKNLGLGLHVYEIRFKSGNCEYIEEVKSGENDK
jgi:hypothetical protein